MMVFRRRHWWLLWWLALAQPATGDDFTLAPQQGVLLLRNGSTLRGFVSKTGDRYLVSFGEAGEARVAEAQVLTLCRSLEEAYQHKRHAAEGNYAAHVDVARWCLKERMLARAADQLLIAEVLHGPHPELELLHQRLLASSVGANHQAKTSVGQERSGPLETPQGSSPPGNQLTIPHELAAVELPAEARAEFTSKVQPLLVNRCATGGCHNAGGGDKRYILLRPPPGRPFNRRMTERNLYATLDQINRAQPPESALLKKAQAAHGGSALAPLSDRDQQHYETLANWIRTLPGSPPASARTEAVSSGLAPFSGSPSQVSQVAWESGIELPPSDQASSSDDPAEAYTPVDPFDPEVFNRRYHSAK